jgi:GT2 family glycosyltransferase
VKNINNIEPLIYIILVNYNSYIDTIECVESIEDSHYKNLKIIIVDNNSNNDSVSIMKDKLKKHIIIESNENLGFSGGNNLGIRYALNNKSDYILLLNNDTIVHPDFLEPLIKAFNENRNAGIITGQIYYYDDKELLWFDGAYCNRKKGQIYHKNIKMHNNPNLKNIEEQQFLTGCFMLIPSYIFESVGLLDEKYFLYYEDTDYCIKVKKKNYKLLINRESRIYHKVSKSTDENSNLYLYYNTRNRFIFIKENINGIHKIISYMYMLSSSFYKLIKYRNVYIIIAFVDFIKNKTGKLREV